MVSKLTIFTTPKWIITLFIASHLVLLLMMTITFPRIESVIQTTPFDLRTFGYTLEEAGHILDKMDPGTRSLYVFPQILLLDVLYPLLLALLLSTLMMRMGRLSGFASRFFRALTILPFVGMLCDYAENTCVLALLQGWREPSQGFVSMASTFTQLKSLFTSLAWLLIFFQTVVWLRIKLVSKKATVYG